MYVNRMRSEERKPVVMRQDRSQQRGYYGRALEDTTTEHYKWAEIDLTSVDSPPYLFHIIHVKMNF